jgi:hypothetical protein
MGRPKLEDQDGPDLPAVVGIPKIEESGAGFRLREGCPKRA